MFDFIVFVTITISFVYLMSSVANLKIKNIALTHDLLQSYIDRNIIAEELKSTLEKKDSPSLEQTDDFLKFISQSRDWAFDYIETTQAQINDIANKIGPFADYLEKYAPPILLDEQRLLVIEAYKEIKSMIPEDYGKLDT